MLNTGLTVQIICLLVFFPDLLVCFVLVLKLFVWFILICMSVCLLCSILFVLLVCCLFCLFLLGV